MKRYSAGISLTQQLPKLAIDECSNPILPSTPYNKSACRCPKTFDGRTNMTTQACEAVIRTAPTGNRIRGVGDWLVERTS